MTGELDKSNSRWTKRLARGKELRADYPELAPALEGHRYWAVYLAPHRTPGVLSGGGDIFVFVDDQTGAILGVLRGR
jgi:hypothetical protein